MLKLANFVNIANINKFTIFNTKIIVAYFISLNTLIVVNTLIIQIFCHGTRVWIIKLLITKLTYKT